jgi:hypothetical protein
MRIRHVQRLLVFTSMFIVILRVDAQSTPPAPAAPTTDDRGASEQQLKQEISELRQLMLQLRAETEHYRSEVRELQSELHAAVSARPTSSETAEAASPDKAPQTAVPADGSGDRIVALEDEARLLTGKVDDQYQTKVESGSRYRVRLSGIALFNAFANRGSVDSIDVPQHAEIPGLLGEHGSIGASFRQTQIGMEVFGPEWRGARIDANLRFDFAGGFPDTINGVAFGLPRLRTGTINLRWSHTTIVSGQDAPFISALSPSSLASLAEPAFSYSGNLWYWIPQVRLEHRIAVSEKSSAIIEAGLLDPLTGEPPRTPYDRSVTTGEASRSPAYAARVAWARGKDDSLSIGAGGYFSRQNWGFGRIVNSWAGTLDWEVPLAQRFAVRGELYRGSALGGLGATGGHSILSTSVLNDPRGIVQGVQTLGGWTQLKFRATSTLEFNGGFGLENPFSSQLRQLSAIQARFYPDLGINRDVLLNSIYRPRSNLLLSLEYRHLYSARLLDVRRTAEHVNAAIGVLF